MAGEPNPASRHIRRERSDVQEHRRLLLAAAKRLFSSQGVEHTSMYAIARAAGVGQGTLYRRFAHKGELCQALIADDIEDFRTHAESLVTGSAAPADTMARLDALLVALIQLTEQHLPLFGVIEQTQTSPGRRPRPFQSPFHARLREWITSLLAEASATGELAPMDIEYTADAILAVVAPPVLGYQRLDRGYSQERIIAGLRRLFIEAPGLKPG